MQLSTHFTLAEFTASSKALALGIDNTLPGGLLSAAIESAKMMERIRAYLCKVAGHDVPVIVSSGYRCAKLNAAVDGSMTSDHLKACAWDWTAPRFGTPYEICKALAPHVSVLGIGQLIHEYDSWVHTSTRTPIKPVNRVITINKDGSFAGIQTSALERV